MNSLTEDFRFVAASQRGGHPSGLYLLFSAELLARLAYFGFQGILVLFLTASVRSGGFGWPEAAALQLVGIATGLAYVAPIAGGWIADRFLGHGVSIVLGGLLLAVGFALLASPWFIPILVAKTTGFPIVALLSNNFPILGGFASGSQAIVQVGESAAALNATLMAYRMVSAAFFSGLAMIVTGTGFWASSLYAMVDRVYAPDDRRRDTGWIIFYSAISIGFFLSNFVVGTLGETEGWHFGFLAAAAVMVLALLLYCALNRHFLTPIPRTRVMRSNDGGTTDRLLNPEKSGLKAILALSIFSMIFFAALQQVAGVVNLFIARDINRSVQGIVIPATWFQSLSPAFGIILAPLFASWSSRMARSGKAISVPALMIAALLLASMAFIVLSGAILDSWSATGGLASPWWIVFYSLIITAGDYLSMPAFAALIGLVSPKPLVGTMMGLWIGTAGMGSIVAGVIASSLTPYGIAVIFGVTILQCLVAAIVLYFVSPKIRRWIADAGPGSDCVAGL